MVLRPGSATAGGRASGVTRTKPKVNIDDSDGTMQRLQFSAKYAF